MTIKDTTYFMELDYSIIVESIAEEDGGGFLAYYEDLPGIMGDGETKEAAVADARNAFQSYVEVQIQDRRHVVEPGEGVKAQRYNISCPPSLIHRVDEFASAHRMNRSEFFRIAAEQMMTNAS
ncbi:MAG: ribbon-helix-helix protein, CopG family [Campylobacterales bacterium]